MNNNKDLLKITGKIIEDIGNDTTKKVQAFSKICAMLADEEDKAIQIMFITEISEKYGYKKNELKDAVKDFEKKRLTKAKDQEEATTLIDLQEMAIASNFDIKLNTISHQYEITDYGTSNDVTQWDILRKLKKSNISISESDLKIILKSNFIEKINPIRDYFEMLPDWDNKTDHIKKLTSYIQVNENDRLRFETQFKKALIRSIACSLGKDFNKQCFVFVGDGIHNQNSGKTSFIRWLAPPDLEKYYLEDMPENSTDGLRVLAENFIINLEELEILYRKEVNKLKGVFSKKDVKVRIQYEVNFINVKRIANFWGSTNEGKFLTDTTGSVRWVTFKLAPVRKPINWDYSTDPETNINKVWAQAYRLYKNGEPYHLTMEEIAENELANNEFLNLPSEYDLIQMYYSPGNLKDHDGFYTSTDFINELNIHARNNVKLNNVVIGKILGLLKFEKSSGYVTTVANRPKHVTKGYYIKINDEFERSRNVDNRKAQKINHPNI